MTIPHWKRLLITGAAGRLGSQLRNGLRGTALTIRGCQLQRPTLQELEPQLSRLSVPTLVIAGDDDDPCLAAGVYLKRTVPDARLCVLPRTTHTVNLEEPDAFDRVVLDFLADVDGSRRS